MSDMSVQAGVDGKIDHYVTFVRFPATAGARSRNKRENRSVAHQETEFRIGQRTGERTPPLSLQIARPGQLPQRSLLTL